MKYREENFKQEKSEISPQDLEILQKDFPDAQLECVSLEEVPEAAFEYFGAKKPTDLSEEEYVRKNFDEFFIITLSNGEKVYAARGRFREDPSGKDDEEFIEEVTRFVDMRDGEKVGYGSLKHMISHQDDRLFRDKPRVGYTYTEKDFREQGLGKRRLLLMHAFSRMRYDKPLYSGVSHTDLARETWKSLAKAGRARRFRDGKYNRYVMLDL